MSPLPRVRAALVGLAVGVLGTTGCIPFFDPCPQTEDVELSGQLDGQPFALVYINGSTIPSGGFQPEPGVKRLHQADLRFYTTEAERGSTCSDLLKTKGDVILNYKFSDPDGSNVEDDWELGGFERHHRLNITILRGGGQSQHVHVLVAEEIPYLLSVSRTVDFSFGGRQRRADVTLYFCRNISCAPVQ